MVSKNRRKSGKIEKWSYFYLNNALHKVLKRNRAEDLIIAWDYQQGKRVSYIMTDVLRNKKRAYSVPQAAKMFNRHPDTIKRHMRSKEIPYPQYAYTLDENKRITKYLFSENEIRDMHDFFKNVHRGRPRIDGDVTSSNIPSPAELEALMRNEKILYTKNEDGEFVVVWKQPEW